MSGFDSVSGEGGVCLECGEDEEGEVEVFAWHWG